MNDKDKEAYTIYENTILQREGYLYIAREAWQAACEYKQKEYSNIMDAMTRTSQNNAKLQAENADLRIEVEQWKAAAMAESEVNEELEKKYPKGGA